MLRADQTIDLTEPVQGRCEICGLLVLDIRERTVPVDGGEHQCPRCSHVTAAPDYAARVACAECGLHFVGAGMTEDDRAGLCQVERRHGADLRALLDNARGRR